MKAKILFISMLLTLIAAFPAQSLYKNTASQKICLVAWDTADDEPQTGDSANITFYYDIDGGGTGTSMGSPTEIDATNMPGSYCDDVDATISNGDLILFSGTSSTADVEILPIMVYTRVGSSTGLTVDLDQAAGTLADSQIDTITVNVGAGGIPVGGFASGAITAAAIATAAIGNDEFNVTETLTANPAAGGIGDAALAGGLEIVFETDFATNYNTTRNAWVTNFTDTIGTHPVVNLDTATGTLSDAQIDNDALGEAPSNWATATGFSTHTAADVWSVVTRVLTANTNLNDPTAATIAAAVWDEDATGHQTLGTFGQAVGDPGADSDTIWNLVNTNVDAQISTRSTVTQAQVTGGAYALDTDANGRIRIVDGTGAGEIDTSGGAVVSVTTAATCTALGANAVDNTSTNLTETLNCDVVAGGIAAGDFGANAITDASVANDVQVDVVTIETVDATNQINSEIDTALADARLDELLSADSDIDGAAPPTDGSVFQELMTSSATGFTYVQADDSLQAISESGGGGPTAAQIVDEWETQSQADPTGFHVNVIEVAGTTQTANDNGADINAILVDTGEIGAAGAGLTAVPWNSAWDTEVQSEAADALVAIDLDHWTNDGSGIPSVTAGTFLDQLLDDGTAVYDRTTDSLQAIADSGGGGPTAAQIVDEWETQSQADPTGFHVNVLEVNGTAQTANDNGADINAILVDTAEIGAAGAGLTDLGGMSTAMQAEVEAEATDALEADHLDHLLAATYDSVSPPGAVDSLLNEMTEDDGGLVRYTANALEQASGTGASAADIWTYGTRVLTAGTNLNDISAAEVNTQVDTALTDIHLDHIFATNYDPASKPGVTTALLNELVENDAGDARFTANALEQGSGTGLSAEQTRAALGGFGGTISAVGTQTSLTLGNGPATADALNDRYTIAFFDTSDSAEPVCHRRITDWTAGQVVTLDSACDITLTTSDTYVVMPNAVGDDIGTAAEIADTILTADCSDASPTGDSLGQAACVDWADGGRLDTIIDSTLADTADMQPRVPSATSGTTATAAHTSTLIYLSSVVNDNDYVGWTLNIRGGNCAGQKAQVLASSRSANTLTIRPPLRTDGSGTCTNLGSDLDAVAYELTPYGW